MRNVITLILLGAATAGLTTSVAEAGSFGKACTQAPQSQWLSIDDLQRKVEAQGYKVQKAKIKNKCGELYAIDKSGARVEIFADPANGAIAGAL
jgi:hypothetical protein